jgi:hypothetical protein
VCPQRREAAAPKHEDTFGRGGVIDDVLLTARDDDDSSPDGMSGAARTRRVLSGFK